MRMTSGNPDTFYPVIGEEKELEMLIIASIHKLKRGNKKRGNEEVFLFVHCTKNEVFH